MHPSSSVSLEPHLCVVDFGRLLEPDLGVAISLVFLLVLELLGFLVPRLLECRFPSDLDVLGLGLGLVWGLVSLVVFCLLDFLEELGPGLLLVLGLLVLGLLVLVF